MIVRALPAVLKEWPYAIMAVVVAFFTFLLATWLPNLGLIWQIVISSSVPLFDKAKVLAGLASSITTNFTVVSAFSTTAIAVLFGTNAAMVTYYVRRRARLRIQIGQASATTSLGGLASGFIGIGCTACGSFVLGPVLTFVGATGFIALLPFQGQEFGLLGVIMLIFSIVFLARKICQPLVCRVDIADGRQTDEKVPFCSVGGIGDCTVSSCQSPTIVSDLSAKREAP